MVGITILVFVGGFPCLFPRQQGKEGQGSAPKSCDFCDLRLPPRIPDIAADFVKSRAAKRGVFQTGGFPDLDLSFLFCPFCPFWDFPDFSGIFPICSGMVRGFFRSVLSLFLGLLRAPTRNSPERVRDTIWTFPEKSGKHPGLETPRFSFSQHITINFLVRLPLGQGQAQFVPGRQTQVFS